MPSLILVQTAEKFRPVWTSILHPDSKLNLLSSRLWDLGVHLNERSAEKQQIKPAWWRQNKTYTSKLYLLSLRCDTTWTRPHDPRGLGRPEPLGLLRWKKYTGRVLEGREKRSRLKVYLQNKKKLRNYFFKPAVATTSQLIMKQCSCPSFCFLINKTMQLNN